VSLRVRFPAERKASPGSTLVLSLMELIAGLVTGHLPVHPVGRLPRGHGSKVYPAPPPYTVIAGLVLSFSLFPGSSDDFQRGSSLNTVHTCDRKELLDDRAGDHS
jgi:hypothetical protein